MTSSRTHTLRNLILETCSSKPTGIHGTHLWNRIRKHTADYTRIEFDEQLYYLRNNQWIVCINKHWWLTTNAKINWQEALSI